MQMMPSLYATTTTPSSSSLSLLPQELLEQQILVPWLSLKDIASFGCVNGASSKFVERIFRPQYIQKTIEWRDEQTSSVVDTGDDKESKKEEKEKVEEKDAMLPPGISSWVRLMASCLGCRPSNANLYDVEVPVDETNSKTAFILSKVMEGSEEGGRVTTTVFREGNSHNSGVGFDELLIAEGRSSSNNNQHRQNFLDGIRDFGIEKPNLLQQHAIRHLNERCGDILLEGPSSMGKSTSYMIGILKNINPRLPYCQALVLVFKNETAVGISWMMRTLGQHITDLNIIAVRCDEHGRISFWPDDSCEGKIVHGIVGTPSAIWNMIRRKQHLNLRHISQLTLDYTEELIEQGYEEQIYKIYRSLPLTTPGFHVCIVVTTTTASQYPRLRARIVKLASNLLQRSPILYLRHIPRQEEYTLDCVHQYFVMFEESEESEKSKLEALMDIYNLIVSQMVVYVNTQRKAKWLANTILEQQTGDCNNENYCRCLDKQHLLDIPSILDDFQDGTIHIVVMEDLSYSAQLKERLRDIVQASGSIIINFDIPTTKQQYFDRVCCSRRPSGSPNISITFVFPKEVDYLRDIEEFYCTEIQELPADIDDVL